MSSAPSPEPPHLPHLKYRPDIDGLRAIAVLSVVVYHAAPARLQGGFIGVDIFFVISGYLISTIIFGSLAGAGFSYAEFYARRIRRIFPSLLLVLAAALGFGWYALLADEWRQLGRHVLGSAAFVQNLMLLAESGYFDTVAESKPLLHLWSLAVEEQFYIFWPLLLAWGWKGRRVAWWMGAAVALSFVLNVALVHRWPQSVFYLPLTRMWELAAGALLAWAGLRRQPHHAPRGREWQSASGLLLIVLGLALVQRYRAFPGFWALLPVLGACLVIAAGPGAWFNRRVLGSRPFVWVGLISYPLYLWHWPLLAFARVVHGGIEPPPANLRAALVAVAVPLAWLSYRFVERPLRRREGVVWQLVAAMGVVALVGAAAAAHLLPPRNDNPGLQSVVVADSDWAYPQGLMPMQVENQTFWRWGQGPGKVLLTGDSHMEQYAPRAVELAREQPQAVRPVVFATRGSCPPVLNLLSERDPQCPERVNVVWRYALSPEVSTVVLGACWACYFDLGNGPPPQSGQPTDRYVVDLATGQRHFLGSSHGVDKALETLAGQLRLLRAAGKMVYLILPIPVGPDFEPRTRFSGSRLGHLQAQEVSALAPPLSASQRALHDRLRQVAQENGAIALDPFSLLCHSDGRCLRSNAQGAPIYKDSSHLRASFVRANAAFLDPVLLAPVTR